jgi:cytochrome c biogenesis protein CcdA
MAGFFMRGRMAGMDDLVAAISFTEYFYRLVFAAAIAVPVVLVALVVSRVARRDFKFSLRTLMIVITIVAITLGLCAYALL